MAVPTNTALSYSLDGKGNIQDLDKKAWLVQNEDRPFTASIARDSASQRKIDWLTDAIDPVDANNAALEGDDTVPEALVDAAAYDNVAQIFKKGVSISGSQLAITAKGGTVDNIRSMNREVGKKTVSMLNSVEARALSASPKVAGAAGTARQMGGVQTYLKTNVNMGASGVGPTGNGTNANTAGTTRAFTETIFLDGLQAFFTNYGKPKNVLLPPKQKRIFSGCQGVAIRQKTEGLTTIHGVAKEYYSDFGMTEAEISLFLRSSSVIVYDPAFFALSEVRPFQIADLAKTGDSEKKQLLWEGTLQTRNEGVGGLAFHDLT